MGKKIIFSLILYISCLSVSSQVISSGKKAFYLNNKPVVEEAVIKDVIPPSVIIISPDVSKGLKQVSENPVYKIAGKLDDEGGIGSLFINSKEIPVSRNGFFVYSLSLLEGENQVSIIAFDSSNNMTEKRFIVDYVVEPEPEEKEFYEEGEYYALLIGVERYSDSEIFDLDNPVHDAKKIYTVITKNYSFKKENVTLLKNPKRIDIINELDRLSGKITIKDNLLIFYAGHGYWDSNANIGYWLPSDARKSSKGAWFRNSTLCDYLKEINSQHTLLIADACFAGGIFKTRNAFGYASKAINMLYEMPSRKAMTSGTLTEVPDRSAFVEYLVKRLENNEDKFLSSEQLFSSFRIAVINNSDCVPQYGEIKSVGDEGGDFIFIRKQVK